MDIYSAKEDLKILNDSIINNEKIYYDNLQYLSQNTDHERILSADKKICILQRLYYDKELELKEAKIKIAELECRLTKLTSKPNECFAYSQQKTTAGFKYQQNIPLTISMVPNASQCSKLTQENNEKRNKQMKIHNYYKKYNVIEFEGGTLSNDTFDEILSAVDALNCSIDPIEMQISPLGNSHAFGTKGSKIACFNKTKPITLSLYFDGFVMTAGYPRPYTDIATLQVLQDILDGYLPSELEKSYPQGVQFIVFDKRHEYSSRFEPSPTNSHHLNSHTDYCISALHHNTSSLSHSTQELIGEKGLNEKIGDSIYQNEAFISKEAKYLVGNSMEYLPKLVRVPTKFVLNKLQNPFNQPLTFDDLLCEVPVPSTTKSETIIKVLDDIEHKFMQNVPVDQNVVNIQLLSNRCNESSGGEERFLLKIRSLSGEQTYTLFVTPLDPIDVVYSAIDDFMTPSKRVYFHLAMFIFIPDALQGVSALARHRLLTDRSQTLQSAGIVSPTFLWMVLAESQLQT